MKITAVLLVKNDQEMVLQSIKSLLWCDEILVINDNSTDKTIQKITALNEKQIKIVDHDLNEDFSAQRNFALEKALYEWVLFVDADEEVSDGLRFEIQQIIQEQLPVVGYCIPRVDSLWGKRLTHGEAGRTKLLRLGRKGGGTWIGKVHERWKLRGQIGVMKNFLYHYPHQSITSFLQEINFYTDIRAKELYEKKVRTYWWSILLFPIGKFFVNVVIFQGFLDGLIGYIHAMLMSFHSFLVRGKLWLLWQKK